MHIKFALDIITSKLGRSIMTVILLVLGAVVISFLSVIGKGTQYAYNAADEVLSSGIGGTGVIRVNECSGDFLHELYDQPKIRAVGSMAAYQNDNLPQLAEIQNGSSQLEITELSYTALNLCNFSLQDGEIMAAAPDERTAFLYLGDDFSEIPVGQEFISDSGYRYVVAGIFAKGQRRIDEYLTMGFDQNHTDFTISCDNCVISVVDGIFSSDLFISSAEGYTIDQAIESAFEIAEKYGIELRYSTLQTTYEETLDEVLTINSILSEILRVVGIVVVVIIICIQIADILDNMRNLGIMYTQGFTQKDMDLIMTLRNAILYLTALLVSTYPIYLLVGYWYNFAPSDETVKPLFASDGVLSAAVGLLAALIITQVITIITFRKLTPIQMLGGKND